MKTRLSITKDIIRTARRHSCEHCAIALVLKSRFPKAAYVAVHSRSAEVLDHPTRSYYNFSFPEDLVDWIDQFDEQGKGAVKPARFSVQFEAFPRTEEQFRTQLGK